MSKRKSQAEMIKQLSDKELIVTLVYSQLTFLFLAITLIYFLFDSSDEFYSLFIFNWNEILIYGVIPGLIVVVIDIILIKVLPESSFDDGGVNKRIFKTLSIPQIVMITFLIALSEELLFRGVIHTFLGFIIASTIFALVHFRYLNKITLLVSIFLLSFLIGYMYELTNNLLVPIAAHFCIDLLLGIYYRLFLR
ncbi:lysostaphin resistance A-like protein [Bacillaceae bacterium W0354]